MDYRAWSGMSVEELRASCFGERLRQVREERLPGEAGRMAVVKGLWAHGLRSDAGAYEEIEEGTTLPQEPKSFLDLVIQMLGLNSARSVPLVLQLAFDLVREEAGEQVAVSAFGHGDPPTQ